MNEWYILYFLTSYSSHELGVIVWGFDWLPFKFKSFFVQALAFGPQPNTVRVLLTFKHLKSQSISGLSYYTCFILPSCPSIAFNNSALARQLFNLKSKPLYEC